MKQYYEQVKSTKQLFNLFQIFLFSIITINLYGQSIECHDDIYISIENGESGATVSWPSIDLPSPAINGFQYLGQNENKSYYLSNTKKRWSQARTIAINNGGQLAIITSEAENSYLQSLLDGTSAFIGLSDNDQEGQFTWVDGNELDYSNWSGTQGGNSNNKDYVQMNANGKWSCLKTNAKAYFIVEMDVCEMEFEQIVGLENGEFFPIGETLISYAITGCNTSSTCSFSIIVSENNSDEEDEEETNDDCHIQSDDCITVALSSMTENADGSITYSFDVTNDCKHAISNVAFALPDGISAVSPNGSYTGTHNTFNVENTTNNPYHSIKFETIGEGVKRGGTETFEYTLAADAPILPQITVAVKYANNVSTLEPCTEEPDTPTDPDPEPSCEEYEGDPCDDNDPCTINDVYDADCGCAGTYVDSDDDTVCDALDQCPGFDDLLDQNQNGVPDRCEILFRGMADNTPLANDNIKQVSTFPNPVSNELNVDMKNILGKQCTIVITNQFGQIIQSINLEEVNQNQVLINTSSYASGMYTISFRIDNDQVLTQKFLRH